MTLPDTPLSLPLTTSTRWPFLIFIPMSEHLRGERDDAHEPLLPQLAPDRAEDAGATGVTAVTDDHGCVLVEADVGTVGTPTLLHGTDDDGLDDVTLLHRATRDGVLDGRHDDVTDAGVAPPGAAEHPDAQELLGTRVVGDAQSRLLLDHFLLLIVAPVLSSSLAERMGGFCCPPGCPCGLRLLGLLQHLDDAP